METLKTKEEKIINYIKDGGGAVQFHTVGNICLSVNEKDELCKVVFCKKTKENPFGVTDKKYTLTEQVANDIISVIN
jgi:hypothetical protein